MSGRVERGARAGAGPSGSRRSTWAASPPRKLLPPGWGLRRPGRVAAGAGRGDAESGAPSPRSASQRRAVEVHLFDFDADLYGEWVKVEWVERLRDVQRFASPEELRATAAARSGPGRGGPRARGAPVRTLARVDRPDFPTMFIIPSKSRLHHHRLAGGRSASPPCFRATITIRERGPDGIMRDTVDHPGPAQAGARPPGRHAPGTRARPVHAGLGRPQEGPRSRAARCSASGSTSSA